MSLPRHLIAALLGLACVPATAAEFRFDGHLDDRGLPAEGMYDLQLTAFPAEKAGASLAAPIVFERVPVSGGRFQLAFELPTGAEAAWVEVAVREPGQGAFSRIPTRTKAIAAPLIGQCWSTTGDSASNPATNFLGTTDATPFEIRTRNARSLRFEPSADTFGSPALPITSNAIGGSHANTVTSGVRGATIAGGGMPSGNSDPTFGNEAPNSVADHYGTVGGGFANRAGDPDPSLTTGVAATVAGGVRNVASGPVGTVAGGESNTASNAGSVVGGGSFNIASGISSTVSGGLQNTASGSDSTVGGGSSNTANFIGATVAGGNSNFASEFRASVGGGSENTASGFESTVVGGKLNCAGGDYSWAAGKRAKVRPGAGSGTAGVGCDSIALSGDTDGDEGTFVWSDSTDRDYTSTGPGQFLARAGGGVVLQRPIGAETSARLPRGYFNVVRGDSGVVQPAAQRPDTVAVFENDTDAFVRILAPDIEERGIAFGEPTGGLADGGIVYNGADAMQFRTSGNITRMTLGADGTLALQTLGSAGATAVCRNASNQFATCSSSARYKDHIADLGLGLAEVLRLRPVGYVWKDGEMADVGFVAEEVARIDERLVTRNAKGEVEGVKYERLTAVLAGAVQELAARESLQAETIARLQTQQAAAGERQARVEQELAELRALVDGLRRERR